MSSDCGYLLAIEDDVFALGHSRGLDFSYGAFEKKGGWGKREGKTPVGLKRKLVPFAILWEPLWH